VDARKSTFDAKHRIKDARYPALDARKKLNDKRIENPHGMSITDDGKLALTIERSVSTGKFGIKLPKNAFQGIMGDFMDRLYDAISNRFSTELETILTKRFT
jgi:hypothetical protein